MSQDQLFVWKSSLDVPVNWVGWSLGISKAGQTLLAKLMESQIWHQLAGSVALCGEGLEKGQWPLLALMADTSLPPCMPLVPFKLLPQCWSSERVHLCKSVCGFFKGNCLYSRVSSTDSIPIGFCNQKL